jgi:hypothetical protein
LFNKASVIPAHLTVIPAHLTVIPAKAGIQSRRDFYPTPLDPGFRRDDGSAKAGTTVV